MPEERNQNQIIRIDARNCFVESLNDSFGFGKAHFTFASYDLSKPSGQRQTKCKVPKPQRINGSFIGIYAVIAFD